MLFAILGGLEQNGLALNDWRVSHNFINSYSFHFLWKVEQLHKATSASDLVQARAGQCTFLLFRLYIYV